MSQARDWAFDQVMYTQLHGKPASLHKAHPGEKSGYETVVAARFRKEWVAMVEMHAWSKTMEDRCRRTASCESFGSSPAASNQNLVCGWEPWVQGCYDGDARPSVGFAAGTL